MGTTVTVSPSRVEIVTVGIQGPAGVGGIAAGTNDGDVTTWDTTTSSWKPNQSVNISDGGTISFDAVVDVGAGASIDWTAGLKQEISPAGATTYTFIDPAGPCNLMLKLVNGGAVNITWPASVLWSNNGAEPNWTAVGTDVASFFFDGTNYYGMAGVDFA